jgi:hypothetical protein
MDQRIANVGYWSMIKGPSADRRSTVFRADLATLLVNSVPNLATPANSRETAAEDTRAQ